MKHKKLKISWVALAITAIIVLIIINTLPTDMSADRHCTDSDGSNRFTTGDTYDWRSGRMFQDRCIDSSTVEEYRCAFSTEDIRGVTKVDLIDCRHGCVDGACGSPDVFVDDVVLSRQPTTQDEFRMSYFIRNVGNVRAKPLDFQLFVEPCYAVMLEPPKPLDPGAEVEVVYSITCKVPGSFSFTSVVDPYSLLQESDEKNNERVDVVKVAGISPVVQ